MVKSEVATDYTDYTDGPAENVRVIRVIRGSPVPFAMQDKK